MTRIAGTGAGPEETVCVQIPLDGLCPLVGEENDFAIDRLGAY
jgi:hypothetical protein